MKAVTLLCICTIALFMTIGCSDSATDVDHHHHLVEHACEHMTNGPATAVTAVVNGTGPDISAVHTRFDITLTDTLGGKKGGYVLFTPAEHGEWAIFLDKDIPLTVVGHDGSVVTAEDDDLHLEKCAAIVAGAAYDLHEETYTLVLGPTTEETVSLVMEEGDHEHHD